MSDRAASSLTRADWMSSRPGSRARTYGPAAPRWFTLAWTKAGRDPERILAWGARLSGDRQWFIQKAIGWWLRELAKSDPERVRRFLADHGGALGAVARREASKYLGGQTGAAEAAR